ncbi:acyl-CoA dehydrogenase family protein [Paraburkholderia dinghuensis]|uniref:Pimeloyl-CoA dehydrogenase small subunit n=1 Tax=Paraburkholderia dinghuensis TaxID=2305225 RepID=A0A3N6Q8V4_9BURK|nr:acyl-CoA dehydrogenase family protein [Paraburkholderia dinghuensis]RQH08976.1 pimeloyl-CoA dehydrogenase small subunit [Paraburkholderia dinghuensis]
MHFQHTEDRRMLADSLDRFISEQYGIEARNQIAYSDQGFSRDMWQRFCELGIVGAFFDETVGGFGGRGFDIAVVFEALGRGLVVEPFLDALMVGRALAVSGNDKQREMIAQLIEGARVVALAHDEPASRYESTRVTARAQRHGDRWKIDGVKGLVQQAEGADLLLVSARTSGADNDRDGISLFLVPRDAPGVSVRGHQRVDGGRAAEVVLDTVTLGADALVGAEGKGAETLEHAIGYGLLALVSEAVGAMEVAKAHTLEYLRTREQFGVKIGTFQALQHRMADLLLDIEQARSAAINAAAAVDAPGVERERSLSAAKYSIGQIGTRVAEEAIQLHGGIGMTWELPLAHYAKRLVMIDHQIGDSDHHLTRYIGFGKQV